MYLTIHHIYFTNVYRINTELIWEYPKNKRGKGLLDFFHGSNI